MRKLIPVLSLLSFCLLFISCETEKRGEIDISGHLLDSCGGTPLVNYLVEFSNVSNRFKTYTDSTGFFKLKGITNYTYKSKIPDPGELLFKDTTGSSQCCGYSVLRTDNAHIEDDFFYAYHTVNSVLSIKLDAGTTTSLEDTLFMSFYSVPPWSAALVSRPYPAADRLSL